MQTGAEIQCLCACGSFVHRVLKHFCIHQFSGDKNGVKFYSVGEGEGGMFQENSIETCIVSRVKQITSPGWMHETSAWTWCTGKT